MDTDTIWTATKGLSSFPGCSGIQACLAWPACTDLGKAVHCLPFLTPVRLLKLIYWSVHLFQNRHRETHSEGYICSETREFLHQIRTTLSQRAGDAPNLSLLTWSLQALYSADVWVKPVSCGNLMLQICFETQQENLISLDEGISSLFSSLRDYQMCHETQNFSNMTHSFWSGNFLLSVYVQRCLLNNIKICRRSLFLRSH